MVIEYVWSLSMYGHWVCMVIEYVWSLSMYGFPSWEKSSVS